MDSFKHRVLRSAVSALGRVVVVDEVFGLSPHLRCVRVSGDIVRRMSWSPGDKVKLQIPGAGMRSYTPARIDRDAGIMDIVMHLHGHGPASAWAASLRGGESVSFLGPVRSLPSQLAEGTPWTIVLGDETAVGLALALHEACPPGTEFLGAIELASEDLAATTALGLPVHAIPRSGAHGEALGEWLDQTWIPPGEGVAWVSGEASAVVDLRAALLARGLTRAQIRVKPYWSLRGSAHRKKLERSVLVA